MWRFHITSRPEIQLFQMRTAHKQTELLNVIHPVLKSRRYVRTKLATLSAASSRAKAVFLCVIPSANLNPGLFVQAVQQAYRRDAHSSFGHDRPFCAGSRGSGT